MNASEEQISALMELQKEDTMLRNLKKQFEELPQRAKIVEARQKRDVLAQKIEQVEKLLEKAEKKVSDIIREDEKLEQRQAEIQKDIDAAGSDYRNMEARSKEMAGAGRRRDALVGLLEEAEAEKDKVLSVKKQLTDAIATLEKVEKSEIVSFQKEGGSLKATIVEHEDTREKMAANIDGALLKQYEKIASQSGIALGVLNGTRCGVCRSPLDDIRLLEVKRQAPLAICPHCKRMLVVAL